jgi:4-hydroxy-tetrahydrodipicolinate reductase
MQVRPYRVIQWGTGITGIHGLWHILLSSELELVGLKVSRPEKVGMSAGDLSGLGPGFQGAQVRATANDADLINLEADAMLFQGRDRTVSDPRVPGTEAYEQVDMICRLLASGKNVISTAIVGMCHPGFFGAKVYDRVRKACDSGQTTLFTTGIEPGFVGDVLVLALSTMSTTIDTVRCIQFMDYTLYNNPDTLRAYGFGRPPDDAEGRDWAMTNRYTLAWGAVPSMVAEGLRVPLDDITQEVSVALAPRDLPSPIGVICKGTIAGHRFAISGIVDGSPRIVLEHVSRIHREVAPDWPVMGAGAENGHKVIIEGVPRFELDLRWGEGARDTMEDMCIGTSARAAHLIPVICEMPPGPKSVFDLPFFAGAGALGRRYPDRSVT